MSADLKRPSDRASGGRPSVLTRLFHGVGLVAGVGACAGLAGLGVAALHARAGAEAPPASASPVSVVTSPATLVDGYRTTTRFTGRLEPARQTSLAFERGGLVVSVALDEGQSVRAGAVVSRLETSQLVASRRQSEARRRELEAQRNLAQLTLDRQSRLKGQGWSPEQRLDEAEATLAQLTAALDQVSAQIAAIDIDIAKSDLKAPFDGRIANRFIDEGAVVAPGTPILSLLETGRQQARLGLPPDVAAGLEIGATYTLRAGDRTMQARIAAKRPDLDTATRTMTVLFEIAEPAGATVLGDLVTLDIGVQVDERGTWLPAAALKEGRRGLWTVLVVDRKADDAVVRPEAVEVLHVDAERVFVRGTLRDGDRVLSQGTGRVVAGQRVALSAE